MLKTYDGKIFVRGFWGVEDTSHRVLLRNEKVYNEISGYKYNDYIPKDMQLVCVYGEKNLRLVKDSGFSNYILMSENPFEYDLLTENYRHKLEILKRVSNVISPKEYVFLDWDCIPTKKIDYKFWDLLSSRASIQANLQRYKNARCNWRDSDKSVVPNAGFVYIRDNSLTNVICENWEKNKMFSEEPAIAKTIDDIMGGWFGCESYATKYEPLVCKLKNRSAIRDFEYDLYFIHNHGKTYLKPKYTTVGK
jgi:hypothetical protein